MNLNVGLRCLNIYWIDCHEAGVAVDSLSCFKKPLVANTLQFNSAVNFHKKRQNVDCDGLPISKKSLKVDLHTGVK